MYRLITLNNFFFGADGNKYKAILFDESMEDKISDDDFLVLTVDNIFICSIRCSQIVSDFRMEDKPYSHHISILSLV
jgi:hypothetical protein